MRFRTFTESDIVEFTIVSRHKINDKTIVLAYDIVADDYLILVRNFCKEYTEIKCSKDYETAIEEIKNMIVLLSLM